MSFFLTLPTTEQRPSIFHSLSSLHGRKDFGVWGLGSSFMGLATWEPLLLYFFGDAREKPLI